MSDHIKTDIYHELAKNTTWVMISNVSMVLVLVLTIVAARFLGDEEFGRYVFLLALTTVLNQISVLGTADYASILVAREPDRTDHIVASTLSLRMPLVAVFYILTFLVAWIVVPDATIACFLVASDWVVRSLVHLFRGVLRFTNFFAMDAKIATVERLAVLICGGVPIILGGGLEAFTGGILVGRMLGLGFCALAYRTLVGSIGLAFDPAEWKRLIKMGAPIGLRGLLNMVAFRIDAVMLGILASVGEVGHYGAAFKFLEASFIFQESVGGAFQPAIARSYGESKNALVADLYGRGYKILLVIGGFIAAICYLYPESLMGLLFGEEFLAGAPALALLVWTIIPVSVATTSITLLDSVDSGSRTVIPFALSAIANIALNALLIPQYGAFGAAIATLITSSITAVVLLAISFQLGYRFPNIWIVGPLAATFAFAVGTLVSSQFLSSGQSLIVGVTLFFLLLATTATFDLVDRRYLSFLLGKVFSRGGD